MKYYVLPVFALALIFLRPFVPTVGHSWPMVYIAFSHIFVGIMLTLLWLRQGRWWFGWLLLLAPTALEAFMFFVLK